MKINYINKQIKIFNKYKQELLKKYKNKFILFENGKVIDSDNDEDKLIDRHYNGETVLFITQVLENDITKGFIF